MSNNYDKETNNMFNRLLNPRLATAMDNIIKITKDFFNNGGGNINCICPSCGDKITLNCSNKDSTSLIENGTYLCDHCNTYFDIRIIEFENNYRILLKKYDSFEDTDIKFNQLKYLVDNMPEDDWKVIFSNIDLDNENDETVNMVKAIKNMLKNRGIEF